MRIRSKIMFLTGAMFLGAVMIAALSHWTMNGMTRLDETIQSGYRLAGTAQKLHGLMKDLMFDLFTPQTYLLLKDVLHTPRFQTTKTDFRQSVQEFETSVTAFMYSPQVKSLLRDQEARDAYMAEGIAYHNRWILECIESKSTPVDRLRFAGGGAISDSTCQILVNVTGYDTLLLQNGALERAAHRALGLPSNDFFLV